MLPDAVLEALADGQVVADRGHRTRRLGKRGVPIRGGRRERLVSHTERVVQPPMFWRSLPGLNLIVRPGGMRTSLPVRGFRPMPRLRGFTWNTPNPRSSMRSPRCMEVRIASNTASTATSALTLVMSAIFDTSLTMSTLIMLMVSCVLLNTIDTGTYAVKAEAK